MSGRLLVSIGVAALLLGACASAPAPNARVVAFTASAERVPRGEPVTLTWQAADAGVQDGLFSCMVTRRFGDAPTATTLQATCAGTLIDVPLAPLSASAVHYRIEVLKQPYDANDPYVASERTVVLDAARYAAAAGGVSADAVAAVGALPDGGALVAGSFAGTATFGAATLISAGGEDAFVAKIRADGTWAWATRAGGTAGAGASGIGILPDGGAIVVGFFNGTATFGATVLASAGGIDAFVARIGPDGTWAWATRAGGSGADVASGVGATPDGGAYVAGSISGTAAFGATTLISAGLADAFVARVHPDGTWAWATRTGGTDNDQTRAVEALGSGGAILAGYFVGSATFGTTVLTGAGSTDAFVARIEPDGAWAWATRAGGSTSDDAWDVSTFGDGSAIVAGSFAGAATFGSTTLIAEGTNDAFVARVLPSGAWDWATRAGGSESDAALGVSGLDDGGALVVGAFYDTTTIGTTTLMGAGDMDVFVARVLEDGSWAWAAGAGGAAVDRARGVRALPDGGGLVAGWFGDAAGGVATASFGTTTLTSSGNLDAFVARIGADGAW